MPGEGSERVCKDRSSWDEDGGEKENVVEENERLAQCYIDGRLLLPLIW